MCEKNNRFNSFMKIRPQIHTRYSGFTTNYCKGLRG
uniref:Uncharacterized protein n=1 Tax=Tetranychus urticae TaxID=32264 RepID=T1JVZ4_TETUR